MSDSNLKILFESYYESYPSINRYPRTQINNRITRHPFHRRNRPRKAILQPHELNTQQPNIHFKPQKILFILSPKLNLPLRKTTSPRTPPPKHKNPILQLPHILQPNPYRILHPLQKSLQKNLSPRTQNPKKKSF